MLAAFPKFKKKKKWDFPGGPVKDRAPNFGDGVSIPGRGTKIPHAGWPKKKKKKKERKEMVTGMSHVLMRMVCEPVDLKYLERIQAAESEISSSP